MRGGRDPDPRDGAERAFWRRGPAHDRRREEGRHGRRRVVRGVGRGRRIRRGGVPQKRRQILDLRRAALQEVGVVEGVDGGVERPRERPSHGVQRVGRPTRARPPRVRVVDPPAVQERREAARPLRRAKRLLADLFESAHGRVVQRERPVVGHEELHRRRVEAHRERLEEGHEHAPRLVVVEEGRGVAQDRVDCRRRQEEVESLLPPYILREQRASSQDPLLDGHGSLAPQRRHHLQDAPLREQVEDLLALRRFASRDQRRHAPDDVATVLLPSGAGLEDARRPLPNPVERVEAVAGLTQ